MAAILSFRREVLAASLVIALASCGGPKRVTSSNGSAGAHGAGGLGGHDTSNGGSAGGSAGARGGGPGGAGTAGAGGADTPESCDDLPPSGFDHGELIWTTLLSTPSGDAIDLAAGTDCGAVHAWLQPGEATTIDSHAVSPGWNLTRFDAGGRVEWIRSLVPRPSRENFGTTTAARLPGGGVVIAGEFTDPVDFGNDVVLQGDSHINAFLARYDRAGKPTRVSGFGNGSDWHAIEATATNDAGDVLFSMLGFGAVDFGAGPIQPTDIVALSADGRLRWSLPRLGTISVNASDGLALGPGGEAVVTATRMRPSPTVQDWTDYVAVVASYDSSGALVREQTFPGAYAPTVALQPNGDTLLLPGYATVEGGPIADFGCGPPPALATLVIVAWRSDGTCRWMHGFAGTSAGPQLATDGAGGVLLAGETNDQVVSDLATGAVVGTRGKFFVLRLDESGRLVWGRTLGQAADGFVTWLGKVAFSTAGVWLAGSFEAALDFGSGPVAPQGPADGFVVRLAP